MIYADTHSQHTQHIYIYFYFKIFAYVGDKQYCGERKHADSLEPAQGAGRKMIYIRIYKWTYCGHECNAEAE